MRALLILVLVSACATDVKEPWDLAHNRIIAVRATPPRIPAGATSEIDALVVRVDESPREETPPGAMVLSPERLAGALRMDAGKWVVTAPDEQTLAEVRVELGLEPAAPVPLQIGTGWPATSFPNDERDDPYAALKTVYLGEAADNPVLDDMTVNGVDAEATQEHVVGKLVDIPLSVAAGETDVVNWLTSCGTMHDFDLPEAYLRVEEDDPTEGDLAVVVRTRLGGVAWRVWSIRAE